MIKNGFMQIDLNFKNIMVNSQNDVQLIDFEHIQYLTPPPESLDSKQKYKHIPYVLNYADLENIPPDKTLTITTTYK